MGQAACGLGLAFSLVVLLASSAASADDKVMLAMEAGDSVERGEPVAVQIRAEVDEGWHINAHEPLQSYLIPTRLDLAVPPGVEASEIQYPEPVRRRLAFAGDEDLLLYEDAVQMHTTLRVPELYPGTRVRVEAVLRYQACDDTTCLRPATVRAELFVPVGDSGTGRGTGTGTGGISSDGSGGGGRFAALLEQYGLVLTLLATALLGLGLNLTPCVYPLISVTVAYFGGQSRTRAETGARALVYVLGIALSFSALGVTAALSGGMFGAMLQKPPVLLFIAGVLVVLALGSFGVYQFQPPAALMRWASGPTGGGWLGALFMGLTMGIVAAPCVGPIVIGLLVFVGSQQSTLLGFLLFFCLALGMGAPYLLLAIAAGAIRNLPRSGEWLVWTERLFGSVLLLMAVYFVSPLFPAAVRDLLLPAGAVIAGVYLTFIEPAGRSLAYFRTVRGLVGTAFLAFAVWMVTLPAPSSAIAWEVVTSYGAQADPARAESPMLLDFMAEWCIPCREMEHTTYVHPQVVEEAERFRMVKADITHENEGTEELVKRFEVLGVPTVVLFSSAGEEVTRMSGYVGPEELLTAMREVE